MDTREEIITGKVCPYCGSETEYVDSKIVYGRSYGMIYRCQPCEAYVGVHDGTDRAKGRLADRELRKLKIRVHKEFDELWMDKRFIGVVKEARKQAYQLLALRLGIPEKYCHIGMFDDQMCKKAIKEIKKIKSEK